LIGDPPAGFGQVQQPAVRAPGKRLLGNQFRRQFKLEIAAFQ
jgi:hypothetical protein